MKNVFCFNFFKVTVTVTNNKDNNCMMPLNWEGFLIPQQPQFGRAISPFFVYVFRIFKKKKRKKKSLTSLEKERDSMRFCSYVGKVKILMHVTGQKLTTHSGHIVFVS